MNRPNRQNRASAGSGESQVIRGRYGSMEIRNAQEPVRFSERLTGFIQNCGWRAYSEFFPQLAAFVGQQRLLPASGMDDYSVYSRQLGFEILMSTSVMSAAAGLPFTKTGRQNYSRRA